MRAVLLGTGSPPPNPARRGPATLLALGDERFLVDAGSGAGIGLVQALMCDVRFAAGDAKITTAFARRGLVAEHGISWILPRLVGPARALDLLLSGRAHMRQREPPVVRVTEIEEGKILEAGGVTVSAFLVDHGPVRPAFGYRFEGGGRSVVVSGDTRPSENLMRWSRGVDCLIHECCEMSKTSWSPGCGWPSLEDKIRDLASYHTQPDDIGRVAAGAEARQLVITHLMPGSAPAEIEGAAARRFAGPVIVGQDLMEV